MSELEFKCQMQAIDDSISMTGIQRRCDSILCLSSAEFELSDEKKEMIRKIYYLNDLDRIHLICAEFLGREEDAKNLREWLEKKPKRQGK